MKSILTSIMIFSIMLAESKISGVSYFGYSIYNIDTEAENDKFRGFELDRVYFTYKKKISDNTSFKFQADMQNKGQAYYMFIKNAKFDIKFAGNSKLTIGMQGMNMFNIAEKTWGNRFIGKTPMDTYKWSASADLGLGLSRSFGNIFTSLLLTNGEGYKGVASEDNNEKISFQAVYGQKRLDKKDGFNLGVVFSMLPYELEDGLVDDEGKYTTDPTSKTSQVFGFFGGFSGYGARIGFDFNQGSNLGIDGHGESSLLNSIYLNYDLSFLKGLSLITRYDAIDRGVEDDLLTVSEDESINDNENKILIGLIYKCSDEGWALSPNLVMNKEGDQESIMNFNLDFQFRF